MAESTSYKVNGVDLRAAAPRLLVVQPDPVDPLDDWATLLAEGGLAVRVLQPFAGDRLPEVFVDDGLLVLGGKMSATDDRTPWLADIRRLFREAVATSRPALGICLGGQILAHTFGGTVVRGDQGLETGVVRIDRLPEAETDDLWAGMPTPFLSAGFHREMIASLPPGAVWLGQSEIYPHQVFRFGRRAWGVQFHPEAATLVRYREWFAASGDADAEEVARLNVGVADMEQLEAQVSAHSAMLAKRFAAIVREASQALEPVNRPLGC